MLNLVWLKSFVAVLDHNGFQAAARQLDIAQPTLSQHLQKLENQLGVLLVHRGRSGCEPTRAALTLLPFARSLLRLEEQARSSIMEARLRVGASSNIGIYMLQPYIRRYKELGVGPEVDVVIDSNPTIARHLSDGELDVAIMEWWHDLPGFHAQAWRNEPVVLIVPPGHPLARRTDIDRDTLSNMALIGGEPGTGTGRLLATYFGEHGPFPTVSMQLGSTEAVKQAVKVGLGASLVLESSVREEVQNGSLVAIPVSEPGLIKELMVIYPSSLDKHRPVYSFVGHLCE